MFETLRRAHFTNPTPGAVHLFLGCSAPVPMPPGSSLLLPQVDSKALETIRSLDINLLRNGIILVLADDMEIIPGSVLECVLKHLAFVYCKFFFLPLSCSTIPDLYGVRQGGDSLRAPMILHRDMSALRNMPLHLSCPLTDVIEKNPPRCPVLIVLPGPSLQDAGPDLQRLARHFAVVCVGRSLQFCLDNDVSPDFVVNLDTDWRMAQLFMGVRLPQTWLISLSNGNISSIASRMRGIFFMDSFHPGVLRNEYRMRESWLSVSICCLGLAEALGAPQVLLLGADNCWAPTARKQPGYAGAAKTDRMDTLPEDDTLAKLLSSGDPRSGNGDFFLVPTAGGAKAQTSFLYYSIAGELDDIAFQMGIRGVQMWQWGQKGLLNPAYYEPLMSDSPKLQTLPSLDREALHTQLDKVHRSPLPIALSALEKYMQSAEQTVRTCLATLLLQEKHTARTHPAVRSVECLAAQGCMPSPSDAVPALEIATASCQEWLRLCDRAWAFSRLYICRRRHIPMRLLYHDESLDLVLDALGQACPDLLLEPVCLTIFPIDALSDAEAQARELYGGVLCHEEPVLIAPKAWQRIQEICTLMGRRRLLTVEEILELEKVKMNPCTPSSRTETKPLHDAIAAVPKAAIFCIYEEGELQVALPIAKALRRRGTSRVLLLAGRGMNNWKNCCTEAHAHGIIAVLCQDLSHAGTRLLSLVAEALHIPRPRHLSDVEPCPPQEDPVLNDERVHKARRKWRRALSTALTVVDAVGAEALFLGGSNNLLDTPAWVEAARRRAIPSVVVGIGEATPNSNISIFSTWPEHIPDDDLGQWVVRHNPRWAATFLGKTVLACPAAEVVAQEELGLAAPMPWQYNAGNQDALVVNGEYIRKTFVAQGFAPDTVIAAGHPMLDALYAASAHREKLRQEWTVRLGLDPAKPVVLCLLPNNKTRSVLKASFGGDHTVLAHLLGRCWHEAGWNVLLNPHVSSNALQFPLLQSPLWHVLNFPAADLITWVDVVVGYESSVEYWVRALGVPNVSYCPFEDVTFINENTDGNFSAENFQALSNIARVLVKSDKLSAITAAARSTAAYWGLVDGKSTERIVELSMNLLSTLRTKNTL